MNNIRAAFKEQKGIKKRTKYLIVALVMTALLAITIGMTSKAESIPFEYTGEVVPWTVPASGYYKLEAWGAAGADGGRGGKGGYGGYMSGVAYLEKDDILYIACGGKGQSGKGEWLDDEDECPAGYYFAAGGWNGGGDNGAPLTHGGNGMLWRGCGAGGGATHIATALIGDGQLSNYESNKDAILIVAGGGGGGHDRATEWAERDDRAFGGGYPSGEGRIGWHYADEDYMGEDGVPTSISGDGEQGHQTRGGYPGFGYQTDDEAWDDFWGYVGDTGLGEAGSFGKGGDSHGGGAGGGGWYGGGGAGSYLGGRSYGGGGSSYYKTGLTDVEHVTGAYNADISKVGAGNGKAVITPLHTHKYTDEITTQPTCTEAGIKIFTCTGTETDPGCGHTYTEPIAALGHAWPTDYSYADNNNITNGLKYKNCTRCSIRLESLYLVKLIVGTGINSVSDNVYKHETTSVSIDATVKPGYTWKHWTGTLGTITTKNYTFSMPAYAVEMTAVAEDITPPDASLTYTPTEWTRGNVTLIVTATDSGIGLHDTPYSWNNGSSWTTSTTHEVEKNGAYSVKVRDKAGNIQTLSATITNIDKLSPVITGLDDFRNIALIDRNDGSKTITISLKEISNTDYGASGVKGGKVSIYNYDNMQTKTYNIDSTHTININITDTNFSDLFYGDFRVTVNAEDNVGNVTIDCIDTTEFTLDSELVHIANPDTREFYKGESGLFTFWAGGYPDTVKVIFPDKEFTGFKKDYSQTFYYSKQYAVETGTIPFYVPLSANPGTYIIEVYSYKNGNLLQSKEQEFTIADISISETLQTHLVR